jgi:hypothetical protein
MSLKPNLWSLFSISVVSAGKYQFYLSDDTKDPDELKTYWKWREMLDIIDAL